MTGNRRMFTRMALFLPLAGLAVLLPSAWFGLSALRDAYHEYAERDMRANANIMLAAARPLVAEGDRPALAEMFRAVGRDSDTRFTLVDADGRVLADSVEDAGRMENHARRPEVASALGGDAGRDERRSATLEEDFLYVALPLDAGGRRYALRAAAELGDVERRLESWRRRLLWGGAIGLAVAFGLGLAAARRVSRPVEALAEGARRFAAGDLRHRLPEEGSGETRELASALNQMAAELDSRFELINRQRGEMRAVLRGMAEGVVAVDAEGRVMFINPAAEKMLAVAAAGTSGRLLAESARQPELLAFLKEAAASAEPLERELRLSPASGEAWYLARSSALPGRPGGAARSSSLATVDGFGGRAGTLAVLHDITRLRRLERMRRDFVANVSHELRTPVTAIQACLETLRDNTSETDADTANFLDMALRNSRRLNAIITDLLLLSGMENDPAAVERAMARAPLRPTLEAALASHRDAAEARSIVLELCCAEDLEWVANHRLLEQAVGNLVDNAVRHGKEKARVRVLAESEGDGLAISVVDEGPGLEARHAERIFERFYRIGGNRSGSGLGLAIVKHIAQAHGGTATVDSRSGQGSVFKLRLPRIDLAEER